MEGSEEGTTTTRLSSTQTSYSIARRKSRSPESLQIYSETVKKKPILEEFFNSLISKKEMINWNIVGKIMTG